MKIFLVLIGMTMSQMISAMVQNAPELIKNSEEIVSLDITGKDQAVLNVCQQYPLELNFLNELGRPTAVVEMRMERTAHASVKISKDQPQSPFILQSAITKETFSKASEAGLDLSETIKVVTENRDTLLLKVNLINCSHNSPRVKIVNLKPVVAPVEESTKKVSAVTPIAVEEPILEFKQVE